MHLPFLLQHFLQKRGKDHHFCLWWFLRGRWPWHYAARRALSSLQDSLIASRVPPLMFLGVILWEPNKTGHWRSKIKILLDRTLHVTFMQNVYVYMYMYLDLCMYLYLNRYVYSFIYLYHYIYIYIYKMMIKLLYILPPFLRMCSICWGLLLGRGLHLSLGHVAFGLWRLCCSGALSAVAAANVTTGVAEETGRGTERPGGGGGFGWNPLLKMGGGHTQYVLLVV